MAAFLKKITLYFLGILFIAGATLYALNKTSDASNTPPETYTLQKGAVTKVASVSGKIEAVHEASLGFPESGIVKEILKKEGDIVIAGEIIASLNQDVLAAEYNAALYDLAFQNTVKKELLRGPQSEARAVTDATVAIAKENLERVKQEQELLVTAAYETLMSADLEALPVSKLNNDTPPVISGNYRCATPGTYTLSIYKSNSPTGYTCTMSGLEIGTLPTYKESPVALGTCGLHIQFDATEWYRNDDWTIEIPNKRGSSYIQNLNAYNLAVTEKENAIALATQELALAEKSAGLENASPTSEDREQVDARIAQAAAIVSGKEALLANQIIRAPFDGVITDIDMKVGEVVDTTKTITLIRDNAYVLKARIPEVDVRNISTQDTTLVTFDAALNEPITGLVEFVSPSAIEIDGVAYYEAHVRLAHEPTWLREGLNADIDVTTEYKENTIVLPKRFAEYENGAYFAYVMSNGNVHRKEIKTGIIGDDGFIEVLNLDENTTVVMPE